MTSPRQDAPIEFTTENFFSSFFRTATSVFFSPKAFYEGMKTEGGLRNPLIFLMSCVVIHTLIVSLFVKNQAIIAFNLINGTVMPLVSAGILFFIITRLFKAPGTFEAALRVNAYAAATALFSWLPLVGLFIDLYRFYLIAIGLSRAFSITVSRAALSIAITIAIYIFTLGPIMANILRSQAPAIAP